jgi:peptidoglycan DL-endopeptidase LytF
VLAFLTGASAPVPGQEYTIRAGDTLFKIATAAYGAGSANAGVTAIEAANPGINPNNLQVGQEIKIPVL